MLSQPPCRGAALSRAPAPGRRRGRRRPRCPPTAGSGRPAPPAPSRRRTRASSGPGCSISDSTPPRDSASVNTSVRLQTAERLLAAAGHPERHHAAEPRASAGPRSRGPGGRAGPGSRPRSTRGCAEQQLDHALGVVAVPLHPHRERLQPAQHQPGVERARRRRPSRSGGRRSARRRGRRRRRRHPRRLAPGRRRARRRRRRSARRSTSSSSARRRRRRAPAAAAGTASRRCCRRRAARPRRARSRRSAAMSAMREQRVGRRLDPDHLGAPGPDRGADGVEVGEVRPGVKSTPHGPRDPGDQPVRAAVRVVRDDHVVARGAAAPRSTRVLGGEARREREARRRRPPPSSAARHSSSAVRVGFAEREYSYPAEPREPADAVLLVGRHLVDRRDRRRRWRGRAPTRVDRAGREAVTGVRRVDRSPARGYPRSRRRACRTALGRGARSPRAGDRRLTLTEPWLASQTATERSSAQGVSPDTPYRRDHAMMRRISAALVAAFLVLSGLRGRPRRRRRPAGRTDATRAAADRLRARLLRLRQPVRDPGPAASRATATRRDYIEAHEYDSHVRDRRRSTQVHAALDARIDRLLARDRRRPGRPRSGTRSAPRCRRAT